MRLLLADDEAYSRESIQSIVSWDELGITHVLCAENGEEGLRLALKYLPDIILTDIRMPRMNGVDMCIRIREHLPDSCIIFMSGYSDKEYLKSAIHLSAMNYLEKPFRPEELITTLQLTAQKCRQRKLEAASATKMTYQLSLSQQAMKNHVVLSMLSYGFKTEEFCAQLSITYPNLHTGGSWVTMLVSMIRRDTDGDSDASLVQAASDLLESRLGTAGLPAAMIGRKDEGTLVLHIGLGFDEYGRPMTGRLRDLSGRICDLLDSSCEFVLAVGNIVSAFDNIYESYQSASVCLQRSFFHAPGAAIYHEDKDSKNIYVFPSSALLLFQKALLEDKEEACGLIHRLTEELRSKDMTLVSMAKNFYTELLKRVYEYASDYSIPEFAMENFEAASNRLWDLPFLSNAEEYIQEQIRSVALMLEHNSGQYGLPYKIRKYIEENYSDPGLSLPMLADRFGISQSYICVVFKKAFRETVNQYILNYRLERSKEYLKCSNHKVKEISSLVGYPDANYYIKLFKKFTGVTPTDYRDH